MHWKNCKRAAKVPDLTYLLVGAAGGQSLASRVWRAIHGETHTYFILACGKKIKRGRERQRRHKRGQTRIEHLLCFLTIYVSAERKMGRCRFSSTLVRQMLPEFDFSFAATLNSFHFSSPQVYSRFRVSFLSHVRQPSPSVYSPRLFGSHSRHNWLFFSFGGIRCLPVSHFCGRLAKPFLPSVSPSSSTCLTALLYLTLVFFLLPVKPLQDPETCQKNKQKSKSENTGWSFCKCYRSATEKLAFALVEGKTLLLICHYLTKTGVFFLPCRVFKQLSKTCSKPESK